jgi:ribonuclease G
MAKEICISSTPHETRLAILEDDQLAEIYYERENEYTLAGSIYNGRVTRVLPGMQSAFVDIGLERDAFLYVTDFLELEDQEESDELEKAAVSGGNQPPREVRHTHEQEGRGGRGQRSEQKQEQRQERGGRGRPVAVEAVPESEEEFAAAPEPVILQEEESEKVHEDAAGTKRWRGRRRRRGGRGASGPAEGQAESAEPAGASEQAKAEPEVAPAIHAAAMPERRTEAAVTPFVLPGESLSKYGGTPVETAPAAATELEKPARPGTTFKPSTLIETPIVWDGSGLLPGESLSRHRERPAETPVDVSSEPVAAEGNDVAMEEVALVEEWIEQEPAAAEAVPEEIEASASEEETTETVAEAAPAAAEPETAPATEAEPLAEAQVEAPTPEATPEVAASAEPVATEAEATEEEADADASHRVDPLPPSTFRLFGLGGKKKKDDEPASTAKAESASVTSVSAYAPGAGLIEEEVIEGEEYETPHHHHAKTDEHDLDDYEEETLPPQMRTGDLGEMLQEAHLDHRIQLNFDEKNGEEAFDEEEGEEEAAGAEEQPAGAGAQPRRERGGRGRRGRGGAGTPSQGNRRGPTRRSMQTTDLPVISDLLKPGQEILVQIAKEPIAKKGARITSHIALPGRFLVFMPTVSHVGVSRKIASDEERQRLKRILVSERGEASGGFIVRTAAEGASEDELRADLRFLLHLWDEIKQRSDTSKSPALIYHDLSLIERILRDQVSANFSNIWVDSEADYERIVRFLNRFSPTLVRRVKLYTKETPLFEHFGIQDEISKALRSKVWLKSGGSIVINQTEALVAIDINTGKYVGKSARLEDTIVKTNLDAVPEIVRQIRLRDLGGIIIIDFIDMDERKNRYKVMAALEEALKSDRAPTKVLQFNDFGLVAITRKRVKQSLERTLSVPCPICQATGMVKSPTTVCNEIYIELRKMRKHFENADVMLRVNPETVKVLKANNASWITEFEELVGKNILIKSDAALHPEQFDIQG